MPNRYLCDVLDEMRKCFKTRNFSHLLGLIEEAQVLANRMEAALGDRKDYMRWHDMFKKEKKAFNELRAAADKLRKEQGKEPKGWEQLNRNLGKSTETCR